MINYYLFFRHTEKMDQEAITEIEQNEQVTEVPKIPNNSNSNIITNLLSNMPIEQTVIP